jgi:hypothetical protein
VYFMNPFHTAGRNSDSAVCLSDFYLMMLVILHVVWGRFALTACNSRAVFSDV